MAGAVTFGVAEGMEGLAGKVGDFFGEVSKSLGEFASGFVQGATASAVGQGVSMYLGGQKSFDWMAVATAGLTRGALDGTSAGRSLLGKMGVEDGIGQSLLRASTAELIGSQLTGRSFDFAGVAAAGLSAPLSNRIGDAVGGLSVFGDNTIGQIAGGFAAGFTSGMITESVRAVVYNREFSFEAVAYSAVMHAATKVVNVGMQRAREEIARNGVVSPEQAEALWRRSQDKVNESIQEIWNPVERDILAQTRDLPLLDSNRPARVDFDGLWNADIAGLTRRQGEMHALKEKWYAETLNYEDRLEWMGVESAMQRDELGTARREHMQASLGAAENRRAIAEYDPRVENLATLGWMSAEAREFDAVYGVPSNSTLGGLGEIGLTALGAVVSSAQDMRDLAYKAVYDAAFMPLTAYSMLQGRATPGDLAVAALRGVENFWMGDLLSSPGSFSGGYYNEDLKFGLGIGMMVLPSGGLGVVSRVSRYRAAVPNTSTNKLATPTGEYYSVAYEVKLAPEVWGRSEKVHFNRANAALDDVLRSDASFAARMDELSPGIADRISSVGGRQNPSGFTWHHDASPGVMHLVPTVQHTPGSSFWRTLHPDAGAAGGYSIWALPAGAPKRN